MEFSKETGQPLLACKQTLFSSYPSALFLPISPKPLTLSTFGTSPRHSILSPVQSRKAFPLHPPRCPTAPARNAVSPKSDHELLPIAHGDGFHTWTLELRLCGDSPGRGPGQGLPSSKSLIWVSASPRAPLGLWRWTFCSSPVTGTAVAQQSVVLGSPPQCLSGHLGGRAGELRHTAKQVPPQPASLEMQRRSTSFLSSNTQI